MVIVLVMMVMRGNGFERKERLHSNSYFDFGFGSGFSFDLGNLKSFLTWDLKS